MFSLTSLIRYSPSEIRPSAGALHPFCSSASKANEPTFYHGDNTLALFINPCEYTTYVDRTPRKSASRKKRFCETNLALGRIGELGKVPAAPFILPSPFILPPSSFSSSASSRARSPPPRGGNCPGAAYPGVHGRVARVLRTGGSDSTFAPAANAESVPIRAFTGSARPSFSNAR